MNQVVLSPESVEAVARRTAEMLRASAQPTISDPWLTREEAAKYLSFPARTFDRKRSLYPEALKPASEHPLRWSRNALDVFKMTGGASTFLRSRPGRKRSQQIAV